MIQIRYTGPALDYSGYGEANRHDILALLEAEVAVSVELTKHCLEAADFGLVGETVRTLTNAIVPDAKIKILHTTPNIYGAYIEPGKYHIGRVFWETDKLPPDFARGCEMVDEIWTGSQFNADAIRKAGVDKPIFIIPEVINPETDVEPFLLENVPAEAYKFYSIFEWTDRKNPQALLEGYWREFEGVEDVALVIKTYLDNHTPEKMRDVREQINMLKKRLNLNTYAPFYIFNRLLDRHQIYRFHKSHDCFVSAHHGEGWGIPQMEAMSQGNLVISTGCGGIHEHIADVSNMVDFKMVPLTENNRNKQWYQADQNWAEINIGHLREHMRWAYTEREASKAFGEKGKMAVNERFSPKTVGAMMLKRLEEITIETSA